MALGLVVTRLYLSNRTQINQQHAQLTYLCNAVSVQRLVLEQWVGADENFLRDATLVQSFKDKIRLCLSVERVVVFEFASTRTCARIE